MASAAAANNTLQVSDEIYDIAKALYEVGVHEGGGSVLKDYYTIFEYRDRRAKFFDKLPGWSRRPKAIYDMVKRDSNYFFDEDDPTRQLDALEVREREIAEKFEVLLPLPTTANTQTIDNFKSCPPIDGSREADEVSEDEDGAMEDGNREVDEAEDDYDEVVEDGRDVPTPGGSSIHSTPVTSPVEGTNLVFNKKLSILDDPASISDLSDLATPMLSGRVARSESHVLPPQSTVPAPAIDTFQTQKKSTSPKNLCILREPADASDFSDLATPVLSGGLARPQPHMAPPQPPVSSPAIDFVQTQKTATSPKNFTVAPGVSSMSRYGMPGPIKSQQRQHTPEQAKMIAPKPHSASKVSTTMPNIAAATDQTDATEPVSKKQKLDHTVAKTTEAPVISTASHPATNQNQVPAASSSAPISTISQPTTNNGQSTAVSSGVSTTTAAPATTQRRLNDIIAGRILPRSKQEAQNAADEQHNRLLAAYRSQDQTRSNTRKSARQSTLTINPDPDFMPHYFSAANFKPEERKSGSIRCICGATENDKNKGAIACETCGVWQHTYCLYGEIDEQSLDSEDVKFLCTVCDPYAHRHVLKRLRAGEAIGVEQDDGEQNGGAQGKGQGKVQEKWKAKAKGKAKGKSKK